MSPPKTLRSILFATGTLLITLTILILITKPFFGNMDDSNFLNLARSGGPWGFHSYYGDPASGFLRNASWFVSYPAYWIANIYGPSALYLVNALVVVAVSVIAGLVSLQHLQARHAYLLIGFVGAFFLWPYTAELLVFPSIQEKTIILGAVFLLWWLTAAVYLRSSIMSYSVLTMVSLVAFTSKAQIILFVPGLLLYLIFLFVQNKAMAIRLRILIAGTLWISLTVVLIILVLTGNYSSGTSGDEGLSLKISQPMLLLLAISVTYGIALILRYLIRRTPSNQPMKYVEILPLLWMITILSSGFVWEWRNYYLSVVALPFAMMVLIIISWIRIQSLSIIACWMALLTSVVWLVIRLPVFFEATSSFQAFLSSPVALQLDSEIAVVYVGCSEAPTHFNRYALESNLFNIRFEFFANLRNPTTESNYFLSDVRLCPVPSVESYDVIWETGSPHSYVLSKS